MLAWLKSAMSFAVLHMWIIPVLGFFIFMPSFYATSKLLLQMCCWLYVTISALRAIISAFWPTNYANSFLLSVNSLNLVADNLGFGTEIDSSLVLLEMISRFRSICYLIFLIFTSCSVSGNLLVSNLLSSSISIWFVDVCSDFPRAIFFYSSIYAISFSFNVFKIESFSLCIRCKESLMSSRVKSYRSQWGEHPKTAPL